MTVHEKFIPEEAMKARVGGGVQVKLYYFFKPDARWGLQVNVTAQPLYPQEGEPVYILQEVGWAPGPAWTRAENLVVAGIGSPDRPTCSESDR